MTAKIPIHATYTSGDSDGLAEYLTASESIQVDYGITMAKTAKLFTDAEGSYGWGDILGEITLRGSGANDPTWVNWRDNLYGYQFSGAASAMAQVWIAFHMPHDYVEGTDIYFHTHWLNATATPSTNNVVWQFEYSSARGYDQEVFPASQTVSVTKACHATRYMHQISETAAITIANLEVDSLVIVRIFRDAAHASDTNTDSIILLASDVHYQKGKFATKNKNFPFST